MESRKHYVRALALGTGCALTAASSLTLAASSGDERALIEKLERQLQQQQQQLQAQQTQINALTNQTTPGSTSSTAAAPNSVSEQAAASGANRKLRSTTSSEVAEHQPKQPNDIPITSGAFGGPFKIPGVGLNTKIGGWVEAQAIYTTNMPASRKGPAYGFSAGQIPVDDSGRQGLAETAFNSQLWLESHKKTDYGPLKLFVAGNFYGEANDNNEVATNQGGFHLLQAYGSLGHFLAGQTWSTFIDLSTHPEINLDYSNSFGVSVIRQTQVRWTQPFTQNFSMDFSLENPYTYAFPGYTAGPPLQGVGNNGLTTNRLPDGVVRANYKGSWGHIDAMGLFRQLRIEKGKSPNGGFPIKKDDTAFAYGAKVAGRFNLPASSFMTINLLGGHGIGRYIADFALAGVGDAVIDPDTQNLDPLNVYAGTLQFGHAWLKNLRSSVFYSYAGVDNKSYQTGDAYDHTQAAGTDLFWRIVPHVDLGGVYMYGQRTNKNGDSGHTNRVEGVARFYF